MFFWLLGFQLPKQGSQACALQSAGGNAFSSPPGSVLDSSWSQGRDKAEHFLPAEESRRSGFDLAQNPLKREDGEEMHESFSIPCAQAGGDETQCQ